MKTCCQARGLGDFIPKFHRMNAGEDWIPIRANIYVSTITAVHGGPPPMPQVIRLGTSRYRFSSAATC